MPDFYSLRLNPLEDLANQMTVVIADTDLGTLVDELPLLAAGNPLEFKIIDNSEDPYTVFKSTQATIRFISTANTNSNTFSQGSDERWLVLVLRGDLSSSPITPIFKGFLVLNDITEDFMPIPNVVTLTATDGLGLLKEIPLQIPPPPPVTFERGALDTNGHWNSNSNILNNNIEVSLYKRNLTGGLIWWVPQLVEGDSITIVYTGDPTQRATYLIGDSIIDFGDYITFDNVILVSGTAYSATDGEQYLIYMDSADLNPKGPYKIIDYISWCLRRANTSFFDLVFPSKINVVFNIKLSELTSDISTPNSDPEHLFDTVYLDSKTFEDEIGTCINMYEVLQRILGEMAVIFHRNGEWWIVRIDEFNGITGTTGTVEGAEEITNGDFASGSGWTLGAGWNITAGTAEHDGGAFFFANMNQSGSLVVGATYVVRCELGGGTGQVGITLGQSGTQVLANAGSTVEFQGTYAGPGMKIRFDPQNTFDGGVDNVSIKSLAPGTISSRGFYVSTFDSNGTFIENLGEKEYTKEIGKDAPYTIFFSKEDTTYSSDRPHNHVKETYNYDLPLEIPSNKDFSRGDLMDTLDPSYPIYYVDNWRFYKDIPPDSLDILGFIRRAINAYGLEVERYLVIPVAPLDALYYFESEPILIGDLDRFDFSVDYRRNADITSSGDNRVNIAQIRLYSDNGTYWNLHGGSSVDEEPYWIESDSTWTTNQRYFVLEFTGEITEQDWHTISFFENKPCPPVPFGLHGHITILLLATTVTDAAETHFSNLRWDYIPYINGSYSRYEAQTNTTTRGDQPDKYKAKRDKTVYMSDSPRPLFKGAMFKLEVPEFLDTAGHIFTDNTDFYSADSRINLPGNRTEVLFTGQQIQLVGSTSNDGVIHILSAVYDAVSNTTDVIVSDTLIDELSSTVLWYLPRMVLTSTSLVEQPYFYDASLYPDGTDKIIRPYGELQVYDVFNQFKAPSKIFNGQMQGLDVAVTDVESLPGLAHLLYMWYFRDDNENTNDRVFMLLTFGQVPRIEDWTGTFREVGNALREKTYIGNIFKYISR